MPDDSIAAANEILFNKFAVQAAQRRALVKSWMVGATEPQSRTAEYEQSLQESGGEEFALNPQFELAGLGADVRNLSESERARLNPESKLEDVSNAFLRDRLLGKQAKSTKTSISSRPTLNLLGVKPGFTPRRAYADSETKTEDRGMTNAPSRPANSRRNEEEDDDDEDDVGRSGLGREKTAMRAKFSGAGKGERASHVKSIDEPASRVQGSKVVPQSISNASSESEEETRSTRKGKSSVEPVPGGRGGSKKKAVSYLDELLAQKPAKKQKTKKG